MKWSEFQDQNPELFQQLKPLCEEIHSIRLTKNELKTYVCEYCHERQGVYSFPCNDVREILHQRFGMVLPERSG